MHLHLRIILLVVTLFSLSAKANPCDKIIQTIGFTLEMGRTLKEREDIEKCHRIFEEKIGSMMNDLPVQERLKVEEKLKNILKILPDEEYNRRFPKSIAVFSKPGDIYISQGSSKSVLGLIFFVHEFQHYLDYVTTKRSTTLLKIAFPTVSAFTQHETDAYSEQYEFINTLIASIGYDSLSTLAGPKFSENMSKEMQQLMKIAQSCFILKRKKITFDYEAFLKEIKKLDKFKNMEDGQFVDELMRLWAEGERTTGEAIAFWKINEVTKKEYIEARMGGYQHLKAIGYIAAIATYSGYISLIFKIISNFMI